MGNLLDFEHYIELNGANGYQKVVIVFTTEKDNSRATEPVKLIDGFSGEALVRISALSSDSHSEISTTLKEAVRLLRAQS
jgi:hypothetical protein